jgi:hypothetical protein
MEMHTASTVQADPDDGTELGFGAAGLGWRMGWAEPYMIT